MDLIYCILCNKKTNNITHYHKNVKRCKIYLYI